MDPRVALAFDLLRGAIEPSADDRDWSGSIGQLPLIPPPFSQTQTSATDLLSWWFRPAASGRAPWDDYFELPPPLMPPVTPQQVTRAGRPAVPAPRVPTSRTPTAAPAAPTHDLNPWITLGALFAAPEQPLADDHAEASLECLYEFIHALGRRDVAGAMYLVTDDYHVLEDDREIDRLGLRHQLESLLDSLQGWELEVSLVTIPEPLLHPTGSVLIFAEIQFDGFRVEDDARRSVVTRRVAVLERHAGQWLIAALSPV
jgi:ketosteroid isomerase-like protein